MADVGDKDKADTDEVKEAADDDLEVLISIWLFNDADELECDGDAARFTHTCSIRRIRNYPRSSSGWGM